MPQPVVFVSYSHKDEREKEKLCSHLSVLQKAGLIHLWSDDRIQAGGDWMAEIEQAIEASKVAILLVTDNFLNSKFILGKEIPRLLKRRKAEGIVVMPVIAWECPWKAVKWLTKMNVRPKNGRPVWGFGRGKVNEALTAIAYEIESIIKETRKPVMPAATPIKISNTLKNRLVPDLSKHISTGSKFSSPNYFRIVYINTRSLGSADTLPSDIENIRDWTWGKTAFVRWSHIEPNEIAGSLGKANLVVLDWSLNTASKAEAVCTHIRKLWSDIPILIVGSHLDGLPIRDYFVSQDPLAHIVPVEELDDPEKIAGAFDLLKLALPSTSLVLTHAPDDLAVRRIIERVGHKRLQLMVQKYFPIARNGYLVSVSNNQAKDLQCKLYVDADKKSYFIKIIPQRDSHTRELNQHIKARKWLHTAAADLRLIPNMEGSVVSLSEAFQVGSLYPVCYESDSSYELSRETFADFYRYAPSAQVESALLQLIMTLATGQAKSKKQELESPWSDLDGNDFCFTNQMKLCVLAALDDLETYGSRMYSDQEKWKYCYEKLEQLIYTDYLHLPTWLTDPVPVARGHIHGNPTSRNCLVNLDDPLDLKLINCGRYSSDGKLVSDLALIERDLKLILMCTETDAKGFYDIEASLLPALCRAESKAISLGLGCKPNSAPTSPKSVKRAYSLVGHVRQRAREVSEKDGKGCHYFAALLYWTLEILQYPEVRPTKKLLALHSAAEIVRLFDP